MPRVIVRSEDQLTFGYLVNGTFKSSTNFCMTLDYCVQTDLPTGPGYVATVVRACDAVTGKCHFLQKDTKDAATLTNAINLTWKRGGGLYCSMTPREVIELITMLDRELRQRPDHMRYLVEVAGRQPDGIYAVNPALFLGLDGRKVDRHQYLWLPDWPGAPGPLLYRQPSQPYALEPLIDFLRDAEEIMGPNYGSFVIALGAMISMCNYNGIQDELGHFNLPVLYGPPMSGKTLAATCVAFITGMTKKQISSRNTMAFLQDQTISSTFPFIWDDPTKEADVRQVAIDLGNAAFRGKFNDGAKVPQTGCLVTANFNLTEVEKYYSRICIIPFEKPKVVNAGEGPKLEAKAAEASAAFPSLLGIAAELSRRLVSNEVTRLDRILKLNLRIQEGIALPAAVAKMILEKCGLDTSVIEDGIEKILDYHSRRNQEDIQVLHKSNENSNLQKALETLINYDKLDSILRIHNDAINIRVAELEEYSGITIKLELKKRGIAISSKSFRFLTNGGSKICKCAKIYTAQLLDKEKTALQALTKQDEPYTSAEEEMQEPTSAEEEMQEPTSAEEEMQEPTSAEEEMQEPTSPEEAVQEPTSPEVQEPTSAEEEVQEPTSAEVQEPLRPKPAPRKRKQTNTVIMDLGRESAESSTISLPLRPTSRPIYTVTAKNLQIPNPLVGKEILHKWKVGKKIVTYKGTVTKLVSGKEGCVESIYRVNYACGDVEDLDIVKDILDGSLIICN